MKVLLRGGTVVTASEVLRADVLVEDAHVSALGVELEASADRVIDVHGRYVMPGGVDVQTHMEPEVRGVASPADFFVGTRAAAFGGTTTIVDFATQERGESLREALDRSVGEAERSCIDYGLHMIVSEVNDSVLKEIEGLVDEGVTSLKVFMAFPDRHMLDDGSIFRTMLQAAECGAMVMVHAENGGPIDVLVRDCIAAGRTDPIFHARTRPSSLEAAAVNRTFVLAELAGVPAYVAVSSHEGLEEVEAARDRGVQAFAETCPHYLFLSEDALERPRAEAVRFVCSPPLRPQEHHDDLWSGLAQGHLQVVASDHAPFDVRGQKDLGLDSFAQIPGGLPAVEDRMTLLFEGGVRGGRFGVNRFVELVATAPAKLFGLYPRKGTIAPGSDADLAVFDPDGRRTISAAAHHMHVDYSCFEGMRAWGLPELVMQRGRVIVEGGEFVGREGGGHFLARGGPVL